MAAGDGHSKRAQSPSNCYTPTVLFDPLVHARVSTEEIFGPVVYIYPYTDLPRAIERANSLPYAFQTAV
ncbi:aldehyde dehydrogenase family protein [Halomonas sp. SH5A2]|nr:aldehyde dehydrogenase family protein [Halomonas sp. SH5A2]